MKTTKRSKMLLSSIAMLLVALVALGSATFAWYTIQRDVDAKTLSIKATTPGGLEICETENGTYSQHVVWSGDSTLNPAWPTLDVSAATGYSALQTSDSTSSSSAQAGESLRAIPTGADGQYIVVKDLWLKNTNSVNGTVTCTITPGGDDSTYTALYMLDVTGNNANYAKAHSGNGTPGAADVSPASFTLAKGGTAKQHFIVLAFVDGKNTNCTTANANALAGSFQIDFSMTDAA